MATYSENAMRGRNTSNIRPVGISRVPDTAERQLAARAAAATPTPTPDPAATDQSVSSYMADATPIEAAQPDVSEETLKKTAEYMARERALASALSLFEANQATDLARYNENYGRSLTDLGWQQDANTWDYGQLLSSGQRATEAGKGFNALANDYAARGMLQSGAYQAARNIFQNQLNEKRGLIEKGKTTFGEDQQKARTNLLAQQEQERTQALADARAAILGGMGV